MANTPIMIRMTPDELAKLDADRGDVNRSAWIRALVANHSPRERQLAVTTPPTPSEEAPKALPRTKPANRSSRDSVKGASPSDVPTFFKKVPDKKGAK